jgi:coenzyme F420-reducing hydrogenase alpha subunit
MNCGFGTEGGIDIAITADGKRVVDVAITNSRPLGITSRLAGLTPDATLGRIVSLFSVCRIAQGLAGRRAVEQALGIDLGPPHEAARSLLLRAETALDHATCALLVWPVLLGKSPTAFHALKALRASLADLWTCLYPDGDWMRPGGGRLAPDKTALAARLDVAESAIAEACLTLPLDPICWRDWVRAAAGPAAELFVLLEQRSWQSFGATEVKLLGSPDSGALERRLAVDRDGSFIAQPEWQGEPRETGPLTRRFNHPLVSAVINQHGRGLTARFLAQCVETMSCIVEMRDLTEKICADTPSPMPQREGVGLGIVEAARGLLAHRVEIVDGHIRRYQILAPTEWNFHPRGALAQGLLETGPWQSNECLAKLLVTALDPCVPYRIAMS